MKRHARQAAPQVQSTLAKLSLCRTAALGGRLYQCAECSHQSVVYNSCGDRHCPQCSGARRANWMQGTEQLLLDGVRYFQVVFTLPSELSRLALGNRRKIYGLLFAAAWAALKERIEEEHGFDPAALMVLHTWNQKLEAHAHVHAVVPGGGPTRDGRGWVSSRRPDAPEGTSDRYLVDAVALRRSYRKHFLAKLSRLHVRGELKLDGEFEYLQAQMAWNAFLGELESIDWVSYIEPPPEHDGRPENVLKYLARYLTGGPISDRRITAVSEDEVTFWAREGKTTGGDDHCIRVTLPIEEFVRRWSLHILPKDFTKVRRFGGWSNTRREAYLERCSNQLEAAQVPLSDDLFAWDPHLSSESTSSDSEDETGCPPCPQCGGDLHVIAEHPKPSWAELLHNCWRAPWHRSFGERFLLGQVAIE